MGYMCKFSLERLIRRIATLYIAKPVDSMMCMSEMKLGELCLLNSFGHLP